MCGTAFDSRHFMLYVALLCCAGPEWVWAPASRATNFMRMSYACPYCLLVCSFLVSIFNAQTVVQGPRQASRAVVPPCWGAGQLCGGGCLRPLAPIRSIGQACAHAGVRQVCGHDAVREHLLAGSDERQNANPMANPTTGKGARLDQNLTGPGNHIVGSKVVIRVGGV